MKPSRSHAHRPPALDESSPLPLRPQSANMMVGGTSGSFHLGGALLPGPLLPMAGRCPVSPGEAGPELRAGPEEKRKYMATECRVDSSLWGRCSERPHFPEETDRVAAQDSGSRPRSAPAHTRSQAAWRPLSPGHDTAPRTLPSAPACEASRPPARKVCWKSPLSTCGAQSCLESGGLRASQARPDSGPGRAPARSPGQVTFQHV